MYHCETCGEIFRIPRVRLQRSLDNCGRPVCPECGSTSFHEISICPRCEREVDADDGNPICPRCREGLRVLVEDFLGHLSKPQLEQLDVWMDGCSIMDRENWR